MSADRKPPFWLVWRRGGRTPVYEHASYASARAEVERLARANPGSGFYVLAPCARGCSEAQAYWSHYAPLGALDDCPQSEHAPPTEEA